MYAIHKPVQGNFLEYFGICQCKALTRKVLNCEPKRFKGIRKFASTLVMGAGKDRYPTSTILILGFAEEMVYSLVIVQRYIYI